MLGLSVAYTTVLDRPGAREKALATTQYPCTTVFPGAPAEK